MKLLRRPEPHRLDDPFGAGLSLDSRQAFVAMGCMFLLHTAAQALLRIGREVGRREAAEATAAELEKLGEAVPIPEIERHCHRPIDLGDGTAPLVWHEHDGGREGHHHEEDPDQPLGGRAGPWQAA